MFEKILVANRGEIACRVFKTAKRMGIGTVAVYSDADRDALHVELADEAVHIGPSPSTESYLVIDRIIAACRETGARAVHPGYGFLSENRAFAEALDEAGITFIGPNVGAIEAMGDKITSKKIARKAGVNTIPGFSGVIEAADHAVKIAADIGYPVMLKASAGGGGKGMRVAFDQAQCRDGFERATNEALSAFGDGRILVEKFIEKPRHIEIQVMADRHGNCIYLNERECSIQRRHQKVIEEAPSPFLDAKTRKAMGEQAVALAQAVDYQSAGTVEFIVDQNRNFYFLEMNTRLQVEHPVTEFITGLDLVEMMIHIACDEPLPLKQEDVALSGWALEARVYAEDPLREFLPSSGRVVRYRPPEETAQVRVDTGVYEGGEVSMFYDPMIAKLITHGADREQAIGAMTHALDAYFIRGVSHNIGFLNAVLANPRFVRGELSTNFIAEEYPDGFHESDLVNIDMANYLAVAAIADHEHRRRKTSLSGQLKAGRHAEAGTNGTGVERVVVIQGGNHPVTVTRRDGGFEVVSGGNTLIVESDWRIGQPIFEGRIDGGEVIVQVERTGVAYRLAHAGSVVEALVMTARTAELNALMPEKQPPDWSKFLLSPMPGLLVRMNVKAGQPVKAGEELAVVEAMKMENVLRASQDVVVSQVMAQAGESLSVDQPILEFE